MPGFCTAGPIQPDVDYFVPPLQRIDCEGVMRLIDGMHYFSVHAPRRAGKTTLLLALARRLESSGRYKAVYLDAELARGSRDVVEAMMAIRSMLCRHFPPEALDGAIEEGGTDGLRLMLARCAAHSSLPLCLLIDGLEALPGDSLPSVLRQLRVGFHERPKYFPQSVVLCGVRNVRDYRMKPGAGSITTPVFNITSQALALGNFTPEQVSQLYRQHTAATGQVFEPEVFPAVWDLTRGQPWLVNALAREACTRIEVNRAKPITEAIIHEAKERLIAERVGYLGDLGKRLTDERIQRVVQPILQGDTQLPTAGFDDDTQYVIDLGLIERTKAGLEISNAIYREVIPRELTYQTQIALDASQTPVWYAKPDGRLDTPKLLEAFQQFFRENADSWLDRFAYREAGPQLLLQAFLQRVVNGGGRIDREYALGRRRTDLLILWRHPGGEQRSVIEVKLLRKSLDATIAEGLTQTADYMDRTGAEDGHLVIFDREHGAGWDDRVFRREEHVGSRTITVWGM